jgi:16S rRNA (guanine966-N2)-methyltransferase
VARRLRIIGGSRRGARFEAPKGTDTRPTSDRVRENAFNLLGPVDGTAVLDLFAGSGAMGLEALSRGALRVVFVDNDRQACRTINANLDKLGLTGATVLCSDARQVLSNEAAGGRRYDLVLIDPPYGKLSELETPLAAYLPRILADDGVVLVESDARERPQLPLAVLKDRVYGGTRLTIFGQ